METLNTNIKRTVFSIVSTKGGVGKTTLTANLAGLFADVGLRVLAIDADMQPSFTKWYELAAAPETGLAEVLGRGGSIHHSDITATMRPNLDIIVSNLTDSTQAWLKGRVDNLVLLKKAVQHPFVLDNYDVVLIDTQGAKGELQRTAAMAADFLLSPFVPDMINFSEFFQGTLDMINELNSFSLFSPDLKAGELRVVINNMEKTRNAKQVLEVCEGASSAKEIHLMQTILYKAEAFKASRTLQTPVHLYDSTSLSIGRAAHSMIELAKELMPQHGGRFTAFCAGKIEREVK